MQLCFLVSQLRRAIHFFPPLAPFIVFSGTRKARPQEQSFQVRSDLNHASLVSSLSSATGVHLKPREASRSYFNHLYYFRTHSDFLSQPSERFLMPGSGGVCQSMVLVVSIARDPRCTWFVLTYSELSLVPQENLSNRGTSFLVLTPVSHELCWLNASKIAGNGLIIQYVK